MFVKFRTKHKRLKNIKTIRRLNSLEAKIFKDIANAEFAKRLKHWPKKSL